MPNFPGSLSNLRCIHLERVGLAADDTTADRRTLLFAGRVVAVQLGCKKLAGTTPHTDVDVTVKKGSTDLLSARAAVVDSSAIQSSGSVSGSLSATSSALDVAVGDVLNLDVDITGGSSPLSDVWADVWIDPK